MEDVMTQVPEVHRVIASPPELNTAPPHMENPPTATKPPLRPDQASANSQQEVNKAKPDISKDLDPTLDLAKTPTTKDHPAGKRVSFCTPDPLSYPRGKEITQTYLKQTQEIPARKIQELAFTQAEIMDPDTSPRLKDLCFKLGRCARDGIGMKDGRFEEAFRP